MAKLSSLVQQELEANPMLLQFLQRGYGNITALADAFKPALEEQAGERLSTASIGMALRRHVRATEPDRIISRKFPRHIEIAVRSAIFEVAIPHNERGAAAAEAIRKKVSVKKGEFFSIAEGSYEIVIFTNQRNKEQVVKLLGSIKTISALDNLSAVTVNWPRVTKDIPGIYYRVTRALALKNISIQSFHTVGAEMMVFVRADAAEGAYSAILGVLENRREFV